MIVNLAQQFCNKFGSWFCWLDSITRSVVQSTLVTALFCSMQLHTGSRDAEDDLRWLIPGGVDQFVHDWSAQLRATRQLQTAILPGIPVDGTASDRGVLLGVPCGHRAIDRVSSATAVLVTTGFDVSERKTAEAREARLAARRLADRRRRAAETPERREARLAGVRATARRRRQEISSRPSALAGTRRHVAEQRARCREQDLANSQRECLAVNSESRVDSTAPARAKVLNMFSDRSVPVADWTAPQGGCESDLSVAKKLSEYMADHLPLRVCAVCGMYTGVSDIRQIKSSDPEIDYLAVLRKDGPRSECLPRAGLTDSLADYVEVVVLAYARTAEEAARMAQRVKCLQVRPRVIVAWVTWLSGVLRNKYPDLHFTIDDHALRYYKSVDDNEVPVALQRSTGFMQSKPAATNASNLAHGIRRGYADTRPDAALRYQMPDVQLDYAEGSPMVTEQLNHDQVNQVLRCAPCQLQVPARANPVALDVLLPAVLVSIDDWSVFVRYVSEVAPDDVPALYTAIDARVKSVVREHQLSDNVHNIPHLAGIEEI